MKLPIAILSALLLQAATFDVASIKPSAAPSGDSGTDVDGNLLRVHNMTLTRCIRTAYGVTDAQITGGPKWMNELRYDITARAEGQTHDHDMMAMYQSLLADRFKLSLHHETQLLASFVLTATKTGLKATPSEPDAHSSTNGTRGSITALGCPMSRLATKLSAALGGAPVVDMTGIEGKYDFTLQWSPDDTTSPSIFTAIQEQLGLKLESRKIPLDVLVIDYAAPPSEN